MPTITLKTSIQASIRNCIDCSKNIDIHLLSMQKSKEKAIAGRTSGWISISESVIWQAKHFGLTFQMTNKITQMKSPEFFIDEMVKGPFKRIKHTHKFHSKGTETEMIDVFEFKSPFGIFGWIAEKLFLRKYIESLLIERNAFIKFELEKDIKLKTPNKSGVFNLFYFLVINEVAKLICFTLIRLWRHIIYRYRTFRF